MLLTSLLSAFLLLFLASCSGGDESRSTSADSDVVVDTVAKAAGGEASEVTTNTVGRQAGDPGVGRSAGDPEPEDDPLIHVLGSIRSVADPSELPSSALPLITTDTTTIATVGCSPSVCPAEDLAPWADGQIEVLNIATEEAASEGGGQLGAYVEEFRVLGITTLGYGRDIRAAVEPVIVRSNNKRIAVHSISLDPSNPALATDDSPGLAGVTALDALRQGIIANRNNGLGVVVLVDWGTSRLRSPSAEQLEDVDLLVEAGADAIIGHGSDFLLRFDLVGQTAVAYGLGNGSITTSEPLRADTSILRLEFSTPGRSCLLPATAGPNGPTLDDPTVTNCS